MSRRALRSGLALFLLPIAGCSGLFRSDAHPTQVYLLRAKTASSSDSARPAVDASVRVVRPFAAPGLDSPHIMLVQSDRRMSFYGASSWPAPAPEIVESLAVQTLRTSGAWAAVQDSVSPFPTDYLLQIVIRRFEADYTGGGAAPEVHVVFDCAVGRRLGREVIANFVAEGSSAAAANRLADVVAAFEDATNAALISMSEHASDAVQDASRGKAPRRSAADTNQNVESPVPSMNR